MGIRHINERDAWVTNTDGDITGIQLHGRSEIVDLRNPVNADVNELTGRIEVLAGVRPIPTIGSPQRFVSSELAGLGYVKLIPNETYELSDILLPDMSVVIDATGANVVCEGTTGAFIREKKGFHTKIFGGTYFGSKPAFVYQSSESMLPQNESNKEYTIFAADFKNDSGVHPVSLYGAREGVISNCNFVGNNGIKLEMTINPRVIACDWKNCGYMVYALPGTEGLVMIAPTSIECNNGIYANRINGLVITSAMIDYASSPITLLGAVDVEINGGYYSTKSASPVIKSLIASGFRGFGHRHIGAVFRVNTPTGIAATVNCVEYSTTDDVTFLGIRADEYTGCGVIVDDCTSVDISGGSQIRNRLGHGTKSIKIVGDNSTITIHDNKVSQPIERTVIGRTARNTGYATEAAGEAVITNGLDAVTVTHGLAFTPLNWQIKLTPTTPMGTNGIWVSAVTDTTFTIHTEAVVSGVLGVAWSVANSP